MNKSKLPSIFQIKKPNDQDYHYRRLNVSTVRFSLYCRIHAISQGILELFPSGVDSLLDVGSADGLLAKGISDLLPDIKHVYALDMDANLLKHNQFPSAQSDACRMPFVANTFTVITAAAIIEHLSTPQPFLQECYRVLKPGGALFLTTPAPFFEWMATRIGYLKDSGHVARYDLSAIRRLCEGAGFKVVLSKKFMISPVYFPGHIYIEALLRKAGFSFLMLNQLVGSIEFIDGEPNRRE